MSDQGTRGALDTEQVSESPDSTFYQFVLNSLPIAVLTVNSDLRITGFNPWAERLTGYATDEALGKYCGEILQGGMCESECPLRSVIRGNGSLLRLETTIQDRWGGTIPVSMSTAGLFGTDGRLIGGLEAFQDISRLKELERQKDAFISMFAHDIKSSLVIIGGFVLRLLSRETTTSEEEQKTYLTIMKKEADKLEFLVTDFLEFSRLQAGRLRLNTSATSIDKILRELVETYRARSQEQGFGLELHIEDVIPVIEADANRLDRVFRNLLDNAFKFSEEGGTITVSAEANHKEVIVTIRDQGCGIDPNHLPYIFDAFYRGHRSSKTEGFGLGLAAVKAIVEAHGGRVHAESEVGEGSTFTLVFPLESASGETPESL